MTENKQLMSESILFSPNIVEKIFSNLSVNDLRRAAGVCWYWHEIVKKELETRNTIESLILPLHITPYNHGFCNGVEEELDGFYEVYNKDRPPKPEVLDLTDKAWHVSAAVKCIPKIFIVFCDDFTETEYPFCYEYMECLPKSTLYANIAFLKITVDGTELYGETNLGSGISIPSTANLKCEMLNVNQDYYGYSIAYLLDDYEGIIDKVDEIMNKLNMRTTIADEQNCFILFLSRTDICGDQWDEFNWKYELYVSEFLSNLKKKYKPGTYSVLATGCSYNCTSVNENPWLDSNNTLFLRIHGSALKSWSVLISLDLTMEEMTKKLLKFNKKIQVNSSTIALCAVPVKEQNLRRGIDSINLKDNTVTYFDPTVIFKQVFPSVTLTCLYDNQNYFQFGCNTLHRDSNPVFKHKNYMIFLLITTL